MAGNPKFHALLRDMAAMHDRKSQDYASSANYYSNFEYAGNLASQFSDPVDIAFATLIGVKLARLAELKGKGKAPLNESVQDTLLDLAVYAALWTSYSYPCDTLGAQKQARKELEEMLQGIGTTVPSRVSSAVDYTRKCGCGPTEGCSRCVDLGLQPPGVRR